MAITDAERSVYQVRQFDITPGRGESVLSHLATPPETAAAAEALSLADAQRRGEGVAGNATAAVQRGLLTSHRDLIKDEYDSTTIAPASGTPRGAAAPRGLAAPEPAPAPKAARHSKRAPK